MAKRELVESVIKQALIEHISHWHDSSVNSIMDKAAVANGQECK